MNCVHCNAALAPSVWERLPSVFWFVSFTCPECSKENHVPWLVTAAIMLLSMSAVALVGITVAQVAPINMPSFLFVVAVAALLFTVFLLLLSKYLRISKHPLRK